MADVIKIVIVVLVAQGLFGCTDIREASFFVDGAKAATTFHPDVRKALLVENSLDAAPENFSVAGHVIIEGDGAIVSFRKFTQEKRILVDSLPWYEQLTIFLIDGVQMNEGSVDLSANGPVVVYWSKGIPLIDTMAMECLGYGRNGYMRYNRLEDGSLNVSLRVEIVSTCGAWEMTTKTVVPSASIQEAESWE